MLELKLYLLGPPRVELGGAPLVVDTRKATAMLIYLAVTGQAHRRERLAAMFWPESDTAHAKAALRRTLSSLRKALHGEWLEVSRDLLAVQPAWLDSQAFAELLVGTLGHGHPAAESCIRCIAPLTQAMVLYRGDFLAGFSLPDSPQFDEWQYFTERALQRKCTEALQLLSAAHQSAGNFEKALEAADRLLAFDALNETAHRQLMRLYVSLGRRDLALKQYRDCVRVLQAELGTPPLEETVDLYERIRTGELTEPLRRQAPTFAAAAPRPIPLVGREPELLEMQAWHRSVGRNCKLMIVAGEAGVGKSRIAEEFLNGVMGLGGKVLQARCYEGETSFAFRPWIDALRGGIGNGELLRGLAGLSQVRLAEAARLLPEIHDRIPDLPHAGPAQGAAGHERFLDGLVWLAGTLAKGRPSGVVFLDDLQWADDPTLELLIYLLRHGPEPPFGLLAGWRTDSAPAQQRLQEWLALLPRGSYEITRLERLSESQVSELVDRTPLAGWPASGHRLYEETEGLPLFIAEYLRAIEGGANEPEWNLPASIRQILAERLVRIGSASRQLLGAAAVIGRSFEYETLRSVSGRTSEETVAGLEELLATGLIREYPEVRPPLGPSYDFTHEKLRVVALEGTTQARQRLLHSRVARALRRGRLQGAMAARIARHHELAGQELEAAEFYVQAADHARGLYANEQALAHYRSGLALGHPELGRLLEAIGDLLTLVGDYSGSVQNYEAALAYAANGAIARLEHKLGGVYDRWGRWDRAESHFAAGLQAAGAQRPPILADWSLSLHRRGQRDQAQQLIQEALVEAERIGDSRALAQCHNIMGIFARAQGDPRTARDQLLQSLEYAVSIDDRSAQAAALNNLSLALADAEQLEEAIAAVRRAIELSESVHDRHRSAALHSNLADLLHRAGAEEQAKEHLRQSAGLFAEVGIEKDQFEPEIWKLVEW
ncbi:MAG: ATP-binding protein [Anaerolineales bacterium]